MVSLIFSFSAHVIFLNWKSFPVQFHLFCTLKEKECSMQQRVLSRTRCTCAGTWGYGKDGSLRKTCPFAIQLNFQECGRIGRASLCHGIISIHNTSFFLIINIIVFTSTKRPLRQTFPSLPWSC